MDGEIFFGQRDGSRIKIIFYDVTTMADSSFFLACLLLFMVWITRLEHLELR